MHDLRKQLHSGEITWYSNATRYVGGKGEHPGALQHFLGGLPLCQMTHYAERAATRDIKIESLEMKVTGHFTAFPGYGYDAIEYETRIKSQAAPEDIKNLVKAAEEDCYVTNTLKRACNLTGRIFLNGEPLMETHRVTPIALF